MKKRFTKQYIIENKGCYEVEDVEKISCLEICGINKIIP